MSLHQNVPRPVTREVCPFPLLEISPTTLPILFPHDLMDDVQWSSYQDLNQACPDFVIQGPDSPGPVWTETPPASKCYRQHLAQVLWLLPWSCVQALLPVAKGEGICLLSVILVWVSTRVVALLWEQCLVF